MFLVALSDVTPFPLLVVATGGCDLEGLLLGILYNVKEF
jgi:hypothetical protein